MNGNLRARGVLKNYRPLSEESVVESPPWSELSNLDNRAVLNGFYLPLVSYVPRTLQMFLIHQIGEECAGTGDSTYESVRHQSRGLAVFSSHRLVTPAQSVIQ